MDVELRDDERDRSESMRNYLWSITLALYFASLLLPGVTVGEESSRGILLLVLGVLGNVYGEFRWAANVLLLFGLILVGIRDRRSTLALVLLGAGFALAASCMVILPRVPDNGSSLTHVVPAPLALGGYVWVAAHLSAFVLGVASHRAEAKRLQG